jgi:alpha-amylase
VAPRISLSLVIHNHQPVGNFGWVFEDVYRQAYEPMIGALERHPGVRVGLHYTGSLLDWLATDHPDTLERLAALSGRGQVEILGGAYYEPILAAVPARDRHGQLVRMADELEARFGRRPTGAWLAERVWEPSLPADLVDAGYAYTILDDNHLRAASVAEDAMWGAYTTDDQGRLLTLFGTEQGLRYRIPFGEVDDLVAYLREHATETGERVGMMGDDGEKFGAWPGTYEHCWGKTRWVDRCFEALEANADWLTTVTPSDWLAANPPVGRIYVPTASYLEMTEWALPPEETPVFVSLIEAARREGRPEARFLRGAFWRNFQAKYREVNDLHKQMLRISEKVRRMADGPEKARALDHLYRGQSNDCYWHGLFGGVYIVHMRMATLAGLIAAEDLADAELGGGASGKAGDYDLDGLDEVLLADLGQSVLVDLAEGAGIGAWDLRASRVALAAVMRRRPEAYHETLRRHEAEGRAAGSAEDHVDPDRPDHGPKTIHDLVRTKEAGLAQRLVYDWHERRSGLVHLLAGPASTEELAAGRSRELGDFVDRPFGVVELKPGSLHVRRAGHLFVPDGPHRLVVDKRIVLGGDRSSPTLTIEVDIENDSGTPVECTLALESGFNLMGGGGNPAAYYEWAPNEGVEGEAVVIRAHHDGTGEDTAERLTFGNEDAGVRIVLRLDQPARVSWFPIETVSNSEAGFERIYQGSALTFQWPVALTPGARASWVIRFEVSQSIDLRARESGQVPVAVAG